MRRDDDLRLDGRRGEGAGRRRPALVVRGVGLTDVRGRSARNSLRIQTFGMLSPLPHHKRVAKTFELMTADRFRKGRVGVRASRLCYGALLHRGVLKLLGGCSGRTGATCRNGGQES